MVLLPSCTVSERHMMTPCHCGSRQPPTPSPRVHHLALPRMWIQSLRETLQTDNREWTYLYLYLRLPRLLLLQPAASGADSKLNAEHAHCLFIVADVASRYKHVQEWRHRLSPDCGVRRCSSSDRRLSKWIPGHVMFVEVDDNYWWLYKCWWLKINWINALRIRYMFR